jgi:uncharacterized membrane protein
MAYLWLKTFHVAAVMVWVAGILISSLAISIAGQFNKPRCAQTMLALKAVRRWDRSVTSPAMLLFWILGIAMALQAGYYHSTWFWIKVSLAFALGGLHGALSGNLRRMASDPTYVSSPKLSPSWFIILVSVSCIVALVVFKPF